MAQELESFEWGSTGGARHKYPWDDWFNGNIWKIDQGVDFHSEPQAFNATLRAAGYRNNLKLRIRNYDDYIVFQVVGKIPDKEEKAPEPAEEPAPEPATVGSIPVNLG